MRICSLLPSATEILFALGLGDSVVGVTFECDYPSEAQGKPRVVDSVLSHDLTAAEIDRAVTEYAARGESIYQISRCSPRFAPISSSPRSFATSAP